ncbi:MAG TPA: bL28 family ribosomal protein [bacterium]|mgnify:FL=1|nr:bL28 family ribosomal protein [bacterium]HPL95380.1 bL28 family ribosomal protein [bacterium]
MATRCDICGRGSQRSQTRSHSQIKTLRRQYLNLQKKTIDGKQKNVCTRCIRTLKKKMTK